MTMDTTGRGTEFRPFQKALPEEGMTHTDTHLGIHTRIAPTDSIVYLHTLQYVV